MSVSRVIEVSFGSKTIVYVNIDTAYYYNDGVIIKPTDGDLPDTYQVHWADSPEAQTTLETIGTSEGVPVPDELWGRSKVIYGWFYLHPTEDSSVTYKEIRIYKSARAGLPDGTEPTPAEQSTIDQLISAMNSAVEHYPKIIDNFWYVWDTTTHDYVNTNVSAIGVVDPLHFHINDSGELIMTIGE